MSDLGPFAIRRIDRGTASPGPIETPPAADAAALPVLKRAAEAFVDRLTGDVERNSPADAQVAESIRVQSGTIAAAALTPLLGSLTVAPSLVVPARDSSGPSVDPSHDAMRTSVFHPLAELAQPKSANADGDAGAGTPGRATGQAAGQLPPLLDPFLKGS
jgi:hypothetical protein